MIKKLTAETLAMRMVIEHRKDGIVMTLAQALREIETLCDWHREDRADCQRKTPMLGSDIVHWDTSDNSIWQEEVK